MADIKTADIPTADKSRGPWIALLLLLTAYAVNQAIYLTPGACEPDTAGYVILAERMLAGGPLAVKEDDPFRHHSHVWVENNAGEVIPKYTPGYPLLMAVGMLIAGGGYGAFALSLVMGFLGLIGAFLLFRYWMSPWAAFFATATLAVNPVYIMYTNYPLAHSANVCLVLWGGYFLWRWLQDQTYAIAVGAGLAFGFAGMVRPTSYIFILVILAAIFMQWLKERHQEHKALLPSLTLLISWLIFPLLHMVYNHAIFGNPWITGYALSNEQFAFSPLRMLENLSWIFIGLDGKYLSIYFPIGLLGLLTAGPPRERILRGLWVLPTILVYAAYYYSSPRLGNAYFRFFICLMPVFIAASFMLIEKISTTKFQRYGIIIGFFILTLVLRLNEIANANESVSGSAKRYPVIAGIKVAQHIGEGAIIFTRSPTHHHLGQNLDFIIYDLNCFSPQYPRQAFRSSYIGAPRIQKIREDRFVKFYEEHNAAEILHQELINTVETRLASERPVVFLLPKGIFRQYKKLLPANINLTLLEEWEMSNIQWNKKDGSYQKAQVPEKWVLYLLEAKEKIK